MPLFHPNKCYRRKPDLVGKDGQLFNNDASLTNAIEHEGFPDGRRVGRVRIWTGDELNAWWDSRPSEPMTFCLKASAGHSRVPADARTRSQRRSHEPRQWPGLQSQHPTCRAVVNRDDCVQCASRMAPRIGLGFAIRANSRSVRGCIGPVKPLFLSGWTPISTHCPNDRSRRHDARRCSHDRRR